MIGLLAVYFSLYLARVGTFVAVLPLWSRHNIPHLVKVGLSLALAAMWFGSGIRLPPASSWAQHASDISWLAYGLALGKEAVLGALLGYAMGLFLLPATVAGEYLTQEMGFSFGSMLGAGGNVTSGALTLIFEAIAILIFLGLDGHHVFFAVLHGTFQQYPVGVGMPPVPMANLLSAATITQEWGLMLAAPVALCLFLTTVVLVLLARAAPQLNLYTVGFPLRLGVGLAATLVLLPNMVTTLVGIFGRFTELLAGLV